MIRAKLLELSVVMPVYKQEKKVARYLEKLSIVLKRLRKSYEIICIVDGRVDKTYENAKKARIPKLKIFSYPKNQGKGNAVRFGMSKARGKVIGFVDAGFDLDYASIPLTLEHMDWYNADIIIGSKRHPASKIFYPWQRIILSTGYQFGVRMLFGINIRDSQVGLKFFKRSVVRKILPKLLVKTFAFDIEMLAVSHSFGFKRIYEAPVKLKMQFGASTMASKGFIKTAFWMLWDTLAVFYRLRISHYYDKTGQ